MERRPVWIESVRKRPASVLVLLLVYINLDEPDRTMKELLSCQVDWSSEEIVKFYCQVAAVGRLRR